VSLKDYRLVVVKQMHGMANVLTDKGADGVL